MHCPNLPGLWRITTIRDVSGQTKDYNFQIRPFMANRFNGPTIPPTVTGGIVNGLCTVSPAGVTNMQCVINIPDTSIRVTGDVIRDPLPPGRLVLLNVRYTNLLDPGDTGSGNGGQTGN